MEMGLEKLFSRYVIEAGSRRCLKARRDQAGFSPHTCVMWMMPDV